CNKQDGSPTTGKSASPAAPPAKGQNLDQAKDAPKDQPAKDNSADVKAAMERGLAIAKAGDKAKLSAWSKELVLPNHEDWFKHVFGDELGKKVAAEYSESSKDFDDVGKLLEDVNKRGATEVRVVRVTSPDDGEATGLQKSALQAMKKKGPLYSVKF